MNRLIPVILIVVILLGSFGAYESYLNQQSRDENVRLKSNLDATSSLLRAAQDEQTRLESELNQTNTKNKELEANIAQLRQELADKALQNGAITIGLSFMWNPANSIDLPYLHQVVRWMNAIQWRDSKIYFFIDHLGPQDVVPKTFDCGAAIRGAVPLSLGDEVNRLYPEKDIPILIATMVLQYGGCAIPRIPLVFVELMRFDSGAAHEVPAYGASIVTHELAHTFGIGDEVEHVKFEDNLVIPVAWFGTIRAAASKFQMPVPSS